MTSLFIFIGIIIIFALSVFIWNIVQRKRGVPEVNPEKYARPDGCCGAHDVCDHTDEELQAPPEYFDDEELDRFKDKRSNEYSDNEAEEFKEIFYSMFDEEKTLWLRSLRLRHIALPSQVKQEMLAVMKSINKGEKIA